jgi:2-haloacid dehalogenase
MVDPALSTVTTLVFDVMGTVVDVDGSVAAMTTAALGRYDIAPQRIDAVLDGWNAELDALMSAVVSGAAAWRSHRDLRRAALRTALAQHDLDDLPEATVDELTTVIHRLEPFPDSPGALERLRASFTVAALSNADLAELTDLSAQGGLAWHAALSGEFVRDYKPAAAVYRMALELLDLEPGEAMMVAAHPWDLRGAAEHGYGTAYIGRPGGEAPRPEDAFDVEVADLAALADRLVVRAE